MKAELARVQEEYEANRKAKVREAVPVSEMNEEGYTPLTFETARVACVFWL